MSSAFTIGEVGDKGATMPLKAVQSAQVLAEIETTMRSEEVGEGKAFEDGDLLVRFKCFCIRVKPDGSFSGQRIVPELSQRRA